MPLPRPLPRPLPPVPILLNPLPLRRDELGRLDRVVFPDMLRAAVARCLVTDELIGLGSWVCTVHMYCTYIHILCIDVPVGNQLVLIGGTESHGSQERDYGLYGFIDDRMD